MIINANFNIIFLHYHNDILDCHENKKIRSNKLAKCSISGLLVLKSVVPSVVHEVS